MASNTPTIPPGKAVLERALRTHEDSAVRHGAAAALWDSRGEAGWAEFERRCASLERRLAQLEADRISLEDLRARWRTHPDPSIHSAIERGEEEINRRSAVLKADDAALELERDRLSGRTEPSANHGRAYRRDGIANEPLGREQARITRETVADGTLAEREREADRAARYAVETVERLSATLSRTADALDASAALAEEHGRRQQRAGRADTAAEERRVAERARKAADRAREHARELLDRADRVP